MNEDPLRYYSPSGAIPFAGTLAMLVCGLSAAAVMSFLYAAINYFNPFVIVTFLATVICGSVTGRALREGVTRGKVRNPAFIGLVALVVGGAAVYFTWVFYIWFAFRLAPAAAVPRGVQPGAFIYEPLALLNVMAEIAETGLWGFMGMTPKGWGLYLAWLTEAAIIVSFTFLEGAGKDEPFCEDCNGWTVETKGACRLPNVDHNSLQDSLENGRWEVLDQLKTAPADPADYLLADAYLCPECTASTYLSVRHIKVVQKNDETREQTSTIIRWLKLPREIAERLLIPAETPESTSATIDDELHTGERGA